MQRRLLREGPDDNRNAGSTNGVQPGLMALAVTAYPSDRRKYRRASAWRSNALQTRLVISGGRESVCYGGTSAAAAERARANGKAEGRYGKAKLGNATRYDSSCWTGD